MKKILSILLAAILIFALAGCAQGNGVDQKSMTKPAQTAETKSASDKTDPSAQSDAIVVYFSRTGEQYGVGYIEKGNTAIVADMIVAQTDADSFEITSAEDNYPMEYDALTDYAKEEQNNNARPDIARTIDDFDRYDTVYLGYPIWWGDLPMIVYSFLESYDFSGKTVVPFCTHAGSGNAGTQSKIQAVIPDAQVKQVLAIAGTDTQNSPDSVEQQVSEWLISQR